ncbi:M14 family zinc carboxypeptidase [Candidatus Leptofilum sp.]|uniref:M14 family zinc carboxypeptidase n=1 Tax=Candidatus Leptofilum sp. TaxID=3241576 RepID=UPI003B5AFC77
MTTNFINPSKPKQKHFLALLCLTALLLFLPACVTVRQQALPTLAPTAVLPTPTAPATSTLALPPPTLTMPATAVPPTNTPVINLENLAPTATKLIATETAVPTASPDTNDEISATAVASPIVRSIGTSVQGRPILNYRFGSGPTQVIFVGGIHGGYEWNTILLAYAVIDHYTANPQFIPSDLTVHIIPSANPDGQYLVTNQSERFQPADVAADTVPGRFNANNVDLNRNWDCQWSPTAVWRDVEVSGGSQPFSEPENIALRDFIVSQNPAAVVFWHSAANGVFAAGCPDTHPPSLALANVYGQAASYPVYERFTSYDITGDASDWLSTRGIPSISIELRNHQSLDRLQNLHGVQALLDYLK